MLLGLVHGLDGNLLYGYLEPQLVGEGLHPVDSQSPMSAVGSPEDGDGSLLPVT